MKKRLLKFSAKHSNFSEKYPSAMFSVGGFFNEALLQEKVFLTRLDKDLLELTSPDNTVAILGKKPIRI
ncbi:hypothetical protein AB8849_10060 [Proteus vulgaris]|nr:Uncharacterised protein [Proteus vulgaris]